MKKKPIIVITTGDAKGIGPEVTEKALKDPHIKGSAEFIVISSSDKIGFEAIEKAVNILMEKRADGIVTAPVNKAEINRRGISFKGHTEYLAGVTRTKKFAMMFCSRPLKLTIVTRHIALKEVSLLLSKERIEDTIMLTDNALRKYFGIKRPRIGVCGVNPHCGEGGLMGKEEKEIVIPAIEYLRSHIPYIQGPFPADVLFYMAYKGQFDAVVAMYHDQGLCPFKMLAFERGVNVTLGLPFVRTSPDHGTAYDIAGKGIANPCSMKEAIKLAVGMSKRKSFRKVKKPS